ncbi:MBL fold metallo-hydrolase [Candidatus Thorarchaeota archaeon]|nr:MAG: MBL fold metallo-hydrolase [Candidatus Thorarchaeota archaeon]
MKILDGVHLIGSGNTGLGISNDYDCHIYLLDGGNEMAIIDAGGGRETGRILENAKNDGIDIKKITRVFLSHSHSDHAAGAKNMLDLLDAEILAPSGETKIIETADEKALGLDVARGEGRFYPPDYIFPPCPVDVKLEHEDRFQIGEYEIQAISVPGHTLDTMCFYTEVDDEHYGKKRVLFSSDVVFFQGLISLLNCQGSSLSAYREGIKNLRGLNIDTLLPGHFTFCINGGQAQIDQALAAFKEMSVPPCAF